MFKAEYFVHIANLLFLASYLVKDILWVRLATIPAMLLLIAFNYAEGLIASLVWGVLFVLVNLFQVYKIFMERKPVELSDEESRIYNLAFSSLTLKEFETLLKASSEEEFSDGNCIIRTSEQMDRVVVITRGNVEIRKEEKAVLDLKEGSFVGEINYLTKKPMKSCVYAKDRVQLIYWKAEDLKKLFDQNAHLRASWQSLLSRNLALKLYQKQAA